MIDRRSIELPIGRSTALGQYAHNDAEQTSLLRYFLRVCVSAALTDLTVLSSEPLWAVAAVACSLRKTLSSMQAGVCHTGLRLH